MNDQAKTAKEILFCFAQFRKACSEQKSPWRLGGRGGLGGKTGPL